MSPESTTLKSGQGSRCWAPLFVVSLVAHAKHSLAPAETLAQPPGWSGQGGWRAGLSPPSPSTLTAKACVSTGSPKVHLFTPDRVPISKAKAKSIRPVSMQKWEHWLMQKGGEEGLERGGERSGWEGR